MPRHFPSLLRDDIPLSPADRRAWQLAREQEIRDREQESRDRAILPRLRDMAGDAWGAVLDTPLGPGSPTMLRDAAGYFKGALPVVAETARYMPLVSGDVAEAAHFGKGMVTDPEYRREFAEPVPLSQSWRDALKVGMLPISDYLDRAPMEVARGVTQLLDDPLSLLPWHPGDLNEPQIDALATVLPGGLGATQVVKGRRATREVTEDLAARRLRAQEAADAGAGTRRVATTGQYIGAPKGIASPRSLETMRKNYIDHVVEGLSGRNWYADASDWARSVTSNVDEAEKLVRMLAATSPDNRVLTNLLHTVKGFNQEAVGAMIDTGRYPNVMRPQIEAIMRGEPIAGGSKVAPFAENLRVAWDPDISHQPVHDIWQGRAFGYEHLPAKVYPTRSAALLSITDRKGKIAGRVYKDGDGFRVAKPWSGGFAPTQHEFMDREMEEIVRRLNDAKVGGYSNWTPSQAQAAAWSGVKIRAGEIDPRDAAAHYGTGASRFWANVVDEQIPGGSTGLLPGIEGLDEITRDAYSSAATWVDPVTGRHTALGLLGPVVPSERAMGSYIDEAGRYQQNLGMAHYPMVTSKTPRLSQKAAREMWDPEFGGTMPPEGSRLRDMLDNSRQTFGDRVGAMLHDEPTQFLDSVSAGTAFVDAQDASAWHYILPQGQTQAWQRTSVNIPLDRAATREEMRKFTDIGKRHGMFAVDSGRGVNLITDEFDNGIGAARMKLASPGEALGRELKGGLGQEIESVLGTPYLRVAIETGYVDFTKLWKQGTGSGAATAKFLDDLDAVPAVRDKIEPALRQKARQNMLRDAEFAESSGLPLRDDIQEARRILWEKGIEGLREALKNGVVLPVVAGGMFVPLLSQQTQQNENELMRTI